MELIGQHETETGQHFEQKVKLKISEITANQPGLFNGFCKKTVEDCAKQTTITYNCYLKTEHWYLNVAIDKNFANILNKAKEERDFVELLLFTEKKIQFKIDRPSIKLLHTNGLIREDEDGFVTFWVPFYKKRLYNAFYPYENDESSDILRSIATSELFDDDDNLQLEALINGYKEFVKRRGFKVFMERDKNGKFISIHEAALIYSFETYIQAFLQVVDGKSYREADTGLGKSDLIINARSNELLIETKIYYYELQFLKGKKQLAYYCKSLGLQKAVYLVFYPNNIRTPKTFIEQIEDIEGIEISTYLVEFDKVKW